MIKIIKQKNSRQSLLLAGVLMTFASLASLPVYGMSCSDIRQIIYGNYLKAHFSATEFTADLSERTMGNFIKALDPGKAYFLQADVDAFNQKYEKNLGELVRKADCSFIDLIYSAYSKRYMEQEKEIAKWIETKHSFTVDEYLDLDRKKQEYAKDQAELSERWRRRVKFQLLQLQETLSDEKKAKEKLVKRYQLAKKHLEEMKTDDIYGIFLNSFSSALDPHSDYFSPSSLEEFRISTRLSLEGIGAVLRMEDGFTIVASMLPGGAAKKSGKIMLEDKILRVAQADGKPVDVVDMDLKDVVKLIRGAGGTSVTLYLRRDGKDEIVTLQREKIQLEDKAAKSTVYSVQTTVDGVSSKQKIGVIDLPTFYIDFEGRHAGKENFRSSSRDMLTHILKMQSELVDGIIVDLRSNIGGSLDEAIDVAGLFIGAGPVVQIKGQSERPMISDFRGAAAYKGPLVVMIDRQSASASEIFAGAIKDYGRGIIVGDDHTFGKGTVQNLLDLDPKLGAIKVTISKFYTPSGSSTQLKGVDSDLVIPSLLTLANYEIGEKFYPQALPWAQIPAAKYNQFNYVAPYLGEISQRSQKRVETSKEFDEIKSIAKKYTENKEKQLLVSLKQKSKEELAKEEKERKELEAKEKKMDKSEYEGNFFGRIEDDSVLKETVLISSDYVKLMGKQKLGLAQIDMPAKPDAQQNVVQQKTELPKGSMLKNPEDLTTKPQTIQVK